MTPLKRGDDEHENQHRSVPICPKKTKCSPVKYIVYSLHNGMYLVDTSASRPTDCKKIGDTPKFFPSVKKYFLYASSENFDVK